MKAPRRKNPEGALLLLGGSSDLARELVMLLEPSPAKILVHYRNSRKKVLALKAARPDLDIVPLQADLSDAAAVRALIRKVRKDYGAPDKIVHFAAPKAKNTYFRHSRWSDFKNELDVQLRSIVMILREFLPDMAERRRGKVVFVLSSYTIDAPPQTMSHYVTAKYALLGLMKSLAAEYARHGVGVNAVSPAMMLTSFLEDLPPRMVELLSAQAALDPKKVAPVIRFLLSPRSDSLTGENVPVPKRKRP